MNWISSVFLGVLQGVTEWLPISSQGQIMSYAIAVFDISAKEALQYSIWLHLGTMFAAIIYFRNKINELLLLKDRSTLIWLVIATFSTGVIAVPFYFLLKALVSSSQANWILLVIGCMLIATGLFQRGIKESSKSASLNTKNAIITGLAQGLSILPGVSRSGTTVSALLLQGFSAEASFRISFLMSIPAVLAAEVVLGLDEGMTFDSGALLTMLISLVIGFLTLHELIELAKKVKFWKFCLAFGTLLILLFMLYYL